MKSSKIYSRNVTRALFPVLGVVAAVSMAFSCGQVAPGGTDSNTHWMQRCTTHADCGALSCYCGTCTKACDDDAGCGDLPQATCGSRGECTSAPSSVCTAACATSTDCNTIRRGLLCDTGTCRDAGGWGDSNSGGSGGSSSSMGTGGSVGGTGGSTSSGDPPVACACENGVCPGDLADVCSSFGLDHCPPTLDELLDVAHWPPALGGAEVQYLVCGDGSSYVYDYDQNRLNPTWWFAYQGDEIAYFGGELGAACGAMPPHDPGTLCSKCFARDHEPLDSTSDVAPREVWIGADPLCLVDDANRVVMSPRAEPRTATCEAMRVGSDDTECTGPVRYYWNGSVCMPFPCKSCVGEDCGALFESADECDVAYMDCYHQQDFGQFCSVGATCTLQIRGCCGGCGVVGTDQLFGIDAESADTYEELCSEVSCPECVTSIDPSAYAYCSDVAPGTKIHGPRCVVGTL